MADPGPWTNEDHLRYFQTLLKISWSKMTPREQKKIHKRYQTLALAIEGITKRG